MSTLGTRLRQIRELKKLTQTELADRSGVTKGTVSTSERDLTSLTAENLAKICKVLGVSADYLVFGSTSERDDDWRQLSATEEGLKLRQSILNLYRSGKLSEVFILFTKLTDQQLKIVVTLAKSLIAQSSNQPSAST